jgi:hypothetical protein
MARGAVRGAMGAWLGLVALQALTSEGGSGKAAGLIDFLSSVVDRALDPTVPAIPDLAGASSGPAADPGNPMATGAPRSPGTVPNPSLPSLPRSAPIIAAPFPVQAGQPN